MSKQGTPVAIRLDFRKGEVTVSALRQSARGTKFRSGHVKFKADKKDKEAFQRELKKALDELYPSPA